ncbi:MAG TPA: PadR family transcriptional regulator, partial [Actinopolymorphaceae bacterium]
NAIFGWGRAFSYGSLYPCLKAMLAQGWISEEAPADGRTPGLGRRARIVYRLTPEGTERFHALLQEVEPAAGDDEAFGVRFTFFARTDAAVRLRILEGRRRRLEERLDRVRTQLHRTRERLDAYAVELQQHGLESVEREVRWLSDLIARERSGREATPAPYSTDVETPE